MSGSRRFLTERRTILLTYGIAFTIGVIILAYGLWVANWNFYDWLEQPLVQTTLYFLPLS